jgi:nucleoside-diphosphate-sugar epimerase
VIETFDILGARGFIGSQLITQLGDRAHGFTRDNIDLLAKSESQNLIVAAAPAAKWIANQKPEEDLENINHLLNSIKTFSGERCILISTIDVFPQGYSFDEQTPLLDWIPEGYGRNRAFLENEIRRLFENSLILRLPGMFGPGLKKNLIYDLMNNKGSPTAHPETTYQFFDVRELAGHILLAIQQSLTIVNLATEPISSKSIFEDIFQKDFWSSFEDKVINYDMLTRHSKELVGRDSKYIRSCDEIISTMKKWIMESGRL